MKDLMQCALCREPIIRDHEGQVIVVRNKLVVLSDGGIVRVKCPKCGKLQVVEPDVIEQARIGDLLGRDGWGKMGTDDDRLSPSFPSGA